MSRFTIVAALSLFVFAGSACVEVDTSGDERELRGEGAGEISLEWVLRDGGELASCVDLGASEVEVSILGDGGEYQERLSCFGGYAVIDALEEGEYLVDVSLIAPNGERLVTADAGEVSVVDGATVPLGAVVLSVE